MVKANIHELDYEVERDHFRLLEQLPARLRTALANAPYPFKAAPIVEYFGKLRSAGMDITEATDLILSRFNAMVTEAMSDAVLETWGPDHPQARKAHHDQEN